jgi:hypothetical protein
MPENNQPQLVPPQLIWLNIKNSIWMEIPRYEAIMWGDGFWNSNSIYYHCYFFCFLFDDDVFSLVLLATASFASFTLMLTYIRMCFYIPRDQPIRLNSKRQKIYTFDYKRKWWNPWPNGQPLSKLTTGQIFTARCVFPATAIPGFSAVRFRLSARNAERWNASRLPVALLRSCSNSGAICACI